jgi:hypothetical protein
MNDRIHRALDGELDPGLLTEEEARLFMAVAESSREAVEAIRSVPAPDLTARVMAALPASGRQPTLEEAAVGDRSPLDFLGWLWNPRQVRLSFRPATAFAVAVAVLLIGFGGARSLVRPLGPDTAGPGSVAAVVYVQFRLEGVDASSVALAGSFTGWTPRVQLLETAPGIWSAMVPLQPGVHDYTFVIDGDHWVADPTAPAVDDGFGGVNSRLFLTWPEENA